MHTVFYDETGALTNLGDWLVDRYGDDLLTRARAKIVAGLFLEGVLTPYQEAA